MGDKPPAGEASLVSTILNGRAGAAALLADVAAQPALPAESVAVDGGSADGTYEFLLSQREILPF